MKLNEKRFYEFVKENKFEAADVTFNERSSFSVSVFHKEVDSCTSSQTFSVIARGILNGKLGTAATDNINKTTPEYLTNTIKRSASLIENNDPVSIFKGSEKYHKKSVFNKNVLEQNPKEIVDILLKIEEKLLSYDKRINEVVSVAFSRDYAFMKKTNSYGLKLSQKSATYSYFAEVTAKDGEEIRTGYDVFASYNINEFDIDKFVEKVAKNVLAKLGSVQAKSKKYPVVLNPDTASTLISYLISSLDAEEVQKHTSLFEGKLGQQILSKKLTLVENPLEKNIFFRYFDDEGVATEKKFLIKNGVISTYLYTLQTAIKDKVNPTGNGYGNGKAQADVGFVSVKPGKKSEDEMLKDIKEGIYLTELSGLHSGMNANSGNFSLQCAGFMIKDGKKAEPLSLITVADNLVNVFNNIKAIANNSELVISNQMLCPSILIKKMSISGK